MFAKSRAKDNNTLYGYNICFVQSADKLKMGEVEAS